jgi:diacylglycerol kinase
VGFEAIGIALLGFGVGLAFRFNVLLAILLLLLLFSIGYSIAHHVGLLKAVLLIMAVQIIAQSSYFLGLVVRWWMNNPGRWVLI